MPTRTASLRPNSKVHGGVIAGQALRRAYVRVMGARIAAITETDAVDLIVDAAMTGCGHWTITANLDHLRQYQREPVVRSLVDAADLVLADGTPLIWASRLAGTPLPERVAGSNMIWSLSESASQRDIPIFLLGGDRGVAERAAEVLRGRYPGLTVAGTLCPPRGFDSDQSELERIRTAVVLASPQIVFVGLGFPKQDLLIEHLRPFLPGAAFVGVGISLSFVAGEVTRAPGWTHNLGLEWLFRLLQEPRRLVRRYVGHGVPFLVRLLLSAASYRVKSGTDMPGWGWDLLP